MSKGARWASLGLAAALTAGWGCAPLPRPAELEQLEQLRQREDLQPVLAQDEVLVKESEAAYQRSLTAWSDKDLRTSRDQAVVSQIKLHLAATAGSAAKLQARVDQLQGELKQSLDQYARVKKELGQVEEMVQVYEELAMAQTSAREKTIHISEVQQRLQADRQLDRARLALKMAELQNGAQYAPKLLLMARSLIERAEREIGGKKLTEAATTARLAAEKAQEACALSRPHYDQERSAAQRLALNQKLQDALSSLASRHRGLSARLVTKGGTKQLVLPVTSLFKGRGTRPLPARRKLLEQIAAQLKGFPGFHVVIRGHTSYQVPAAQRTKVSRARARVVADLFIAAGLSAERFILRGVGATRLMVNKLSPVNDRVEICILLH